MLNKIKNLFGKKKNKDIVSSYEKIENLFNSLNDEVVTVEIGEDLIEYENALILPVSTIIPDKTSNLKSLEKYLNDDECVVKIKSLSIKSFSKL